MPIPLQQLIPPEQDLLYQEMQVAYRGDTDVWRRVTSARRDAMVDYAVRACPYYQRTIPPGASFEDIPLLHKSDVRESIDELQARGVSPTRRYIQRTSGSTGQPLSFYRDTAQALTESVAADRFFRSLHGVPFDATIVAVLAISRQRERFTWWTRLAERARAAARGRPIRDPWLITVPMAEIRPQDAPRYLAQWGRLRRYFLVGHSSGIDWFAQQAEERGLRIPRPEAIAATSDTLTEHARVRIERVFDVPLHTRYGSNEFPFLAGSLPGTVDRYVFNPLLAHVEILRDDGSPAHPGEIGRIVLTDLNNRVMPMIRYVQGDLATASAEGYVGGFPLVDDIIGREAELLRFPSGRVIGASTLGQLLFKRNDFGPWVRFFQCDQVGANELELRIVWAREPGPVRERMAEVLREAADPDTVVRVRDVEEIERLPSGKAWVLRGPPAP